MQNDWIVSSALLSTLLFFQFVGIKRHKLSLFANQLFVHLSVLFFFNFLSTLFFQLRDISTSVFLYSYRLFVVWPRSMKILLKKLEPIAVSGFYEIKNAQP